VLNGKKEEGLNRKKLFFTLYVLFAGQIFLFRLIRGSFRDR